MQRIASALIFSGRPDPAWKIEAGQAAGIMAVWAGLEPATAQEEAPPALGYRGVRLQIGDTVFEARAGLVKMTGKECAEWREDHEQRFEAAVLASAPKGLLPPSLL